MLLVKCLVSSKPLSLLVTKYMLHTQIHTHTNRQKRLQKKKISPADSDYTDTDSHLQETNLSLVYTQRKHHNRRRAASHNMLLARNDGGARRGTVRTGHAPVDYYERSGDLRRFAYLYMCMYVWKYIYIPTCAHVNRHKRKLRTFARAYMRSHKGPHAYKRMYTYKTGAHV
jgi:hypothetical protein